MIQNEQFWEFWRAGDFAQAVKCKAIQTKKQKGARLFGTPADRGEVNVIAGISAGEFLYDYMMINPAVVEGIDFARSEDLSSAFSLSQFAETIDINVAAGDMAQLQGYVAEQMIARNLEAAGHDVQFPETPNQAGWDILVDGEAFQVKCGMNKSIVDTHLERYPDIPVFVNEELMVHYNDHPDVFSGGITSEAVEMATKSTLTHASDLLDFEIPWISTGVSSFYNLRRMLKDELPLKTAAKNVVVETTSRASLAAAGQTAFTFAANTIFVTGGAFVIVLPLVGAYIGLNQSWRVSRQLKKLLAKKEYQELENRLTDLASALIRQLQVKTEIKKSKWRDIFHKSSNNAPLKTLDVIHQERLEFLESMEKELSSIIRLIHADPNRAFERILAVLLKSGIHVHTIRTELAGVEEAMKRLQKKL